MGATQMRRLRVYRDTKCAYGHMVICDACIRSTVPSHVDATRWLRAEVHGFDTRVMECEICKRLGKVNSDADMLENKWVIVSLRHVVAESYFCKEWNEVVAFMWGRDINSWQVYDLVARNMVEFIGGGKDGR